MSGDNWQLRQLRAAAERLSAGGDQDFRSTLRDLTEVAQAAGDSTPETRRHYPSIPWLVLAEMGRIIRRADDEVDARAVAVTLERDIPELWARLRDL